MRLVTCSYDDRARLGVLRDGEAGVVLLDDRLPATMADLVALGEEGLAAAAAQLDSGTAVPLDDVRLLAPIRPRNNVMCIGKNYVDHAAEFAGSGFDASQRQAVPDHPIVFTKALSSLAGPGDPVDASADTTGTTDYEGELGVVIGRGGRDIAAEDALGHVFGYTVVNDLTVREVQKRHVQFFLGKSAATYCPMGPAILTADEVPDVGALVVRTTVNGEQRQQAPVSDLIFDVPTLIATISQWVLLEPGDVIATGTPAGVGIGSDPPRYLAPGDEVSVTIEPIGTLTNPVV